MESLSPFLQGSFIPYNMPVYPGARRKTPYPFLCGVSFVLSRRFADYSLKWISAAKYAR